MKLLLLALAFPFYAFLQSGDTLNFTDPSGKKQGHWIVLGAEVPNSGVAADAKLEEGNYRNGEREGVWTRYGAKGEVKAVMRYAIDPKTNTSVRDEFYHYAYFPNGKLQRKPVIGECASASDYFIYDENGNLIEAEIFDKECNTSVKLQKIAKGELDSIDLFRPVYTFRPTDDHMLQSEATAMDLDADGEFCIDYRHRLFRIGTFRNGILVEGREIEFDELMRPQKIRYISGGKILKAAVK